MKQCIYVTTSEEAYRMAREITNDYAVMIAENEHKSDNDFNGVRIYVKE